MCASHVSTRGSTTEYRCSHPRITHFKRGGRGTKHLTLVMIRGAEIRLLKFFFYVGKGEKMNPQNLKE